MNAKLLGLLLLTASLASGCIYDYHHDGGGYAPTYSGNVTFTWTFAGGTCTDTNVSYVVIQIPGETLQNNGQFDCMTSGYPGITLNDFSPGTYSYTIDAYDSSNTLLFSTSSSFTVNGDVQVNANLDPAGGANSYAYLGWTFQAAANAPVCGTDFTKVAVTFDGDPNTTTAYDCAAGNGSQTSIYLTPGNHAIELDAMDDSGFVFASSATNISTVTGQPQSETFTLNWVVGGTAISWDFVDSAHPSGTTDCTAVGVTSMNANFQDTTSGNLLYGAAGDSFACAGATTSIYHALPPGQYDVILAGTGSTGSGPVLYEEQQTYTATVQAGVFVTAAQAQNITLVQH